MALRKEVVAAGTNESGLEFYSVPGDSLGAGDAGDTWREGVAQQAGSRARPKRPAHGWLLAKFHAVFPCLYYRSGWPTRDGVIPHKLFVLYLRTLESLDAGAELQEARAAALGIALAMDGKGAKTKSAVRKLTKRAFPEVSE